VPVILETEAKRLWCPYVQIVPESGSRCGVTNRGDLFTESDNSARVALMTCIGKECIAWMPSSERSGSCGMLR
jgi:hypothetical protein